MRLSGGLRVASVAVTAILVVSLFGALGAFGGLSLTSGMHSPAAPARSTGLTPAATGLPNGTVAITTVFQVYMEVPFNVAYNITYVNVTDPAANVTTAVALVSDADGGLVANESVPWNATYPTNYTFAVNLDYLVTDNPLTYANGLLPEGEYSLFIWLSLNYSTPTTPQFVNISTQSSFQLAAHAPSGKFLSPVGSNATTPASVPTGDVLIVGSYNGSFVNGANITVYSGTTVVFYQGVYSPGTPNQAQAFAVTWEVAVPGTYNVVLALSAPYGSYSTNETVKVFSSSSTTYVNKTSYSLIPGFGAGGSAAVLLVVGLIIGMIAALLVARSMFATGKPGPAQPWTETKKPTLECSVCHQTFPTEDELKEHAKTQHGITQ